MEIDDKLVEVVKVFLKEYVNKNKATDVTAKQLIESSVMDHILTHVMTLDLPKTQEALDKYVGVEEDGVLPLEDSSEEK